MGVPGERLDYESLSVRFLVDEDLKNYMSIHNWMTGLGFPESAGDFKEEVTKDDGSTATEKFAGVALTDGSSGTTFKALDLSTAANSQTAITSLDQAIEGVNDQRATVGAYQNRLEFTSSNLMSSIQNNSASVSTIRDADFAA